MIMSYSRFLSLVSEAEKYQNKMTWVCEYGYPADCPYSPDNLMKVLEVIYYVAHGKYREAFVINGDSLNEVSAKYGINYQTLVTSSRNERKKAHWAMQAVCYCILSDIPTESADDE